MAEKYINRFNTFCTSLHNLEKSRYANPEDDFVLEGTVQNFNLTFDISWKVMKDILVKRMGILDFSTGSPRDSLQAAFSNGLISDDEWLQMLKIRNQLAHDYDGSLAMKTFGDIISVYYDCFVKFREKVKECYLDENEYSMDSFRTELKKIEEK